MSRSLEAVRADLSALLPPGFIWSRDPGSNLQQVLAAFAASIADIEVRAEELGDEINPGTANLLLDDYERVLGGDPCGRSDLVTSVADRRLIALQRWTARGGQSPAYFMALAAAFGATITIETDIPSQCGCECGDELVESPEQFVWRVTLPATQEFDPIIGDFEAGDLLGWLVPSLLECVIRRYAPAHTHPVIAYA